MGLMAHHFTDAIAKHLVDLLVPLQGIAQVDHRIEQHHVGTGIKAALAHHQVLLAQFAHQGATGIEHGQATEVVLTHQLHRLLQGRVRAHADHRR